MKLLDMASIIPEPVRVPEKTPATKMIFDTKKILELCALSIFCCSGSLG